MNTLIPFYLREAPNCDGLWLTQIWRWPNSAWEFEHNFIQWLFPTKEESAFNPDAPILDDATIAEWRKDKLLQHNLCLSFKRWLKFCGVKPMPSGLVIVDLKPKVWTMENHNWWRITRVLKSMFTLGMATQALEFHKLLADPRIPANEQTRQHWDDAIRVPHVD